MNFTDAMEALKKGLRVTRQEWIGSLYFEIDGTDVKSYQPKINVYNYNEDIMISDGWLVEGEPEEKRFCDIIESLAKGKRAKLKDWKDSFIYYDKQNRYLVIHSMDVFPYSPTFEAFMANDWIELQA